MYYDIFDRKVGKYEGKITFCGRTRQKHDKNMKKQQEDKKEIERKIEEENKKVMENENKIERRFRRLPLDERMPKTAKADKLRN